MKAATPLLPLYSFMAWTRTTLPCVPYGLTKLGLFLVKCSLPFMVEKCTWDRNLFVSTMVLNSKLHSSFKPKY
jgi:hypothetical protein